MLLELFEKLRAVDRYAGQSVSLKGKIDYCVRGIAYIQVGRTVQEGKVCSLWLRLPSNRIDNCLAGDMVWVQGQLPPRLDSRELNGQVTYYLDLLRPEVRREAPVSYTPPMTQVA